MKAYVVCVAMILGSHMWEKQRLLYAPRGRKAVGKITLKVGGSDETRWCVGGYWSVCVCTCVCPFQQGGEEGDERRVVHVCSHLATEEGEEEERRKVDVEEGEE